jgi:tRNA dimethylallyltransferase
MARPVPCLVGPTASGKTEVAVAAARATGGEVICCDAFAVYRGMEVLTAAPQAVPDVPHHLVSFLDPAEAFSAARFVEAADRLVEEIHARDRLPWIVGGTALYLRSWLKGLGAGVPRDPRLRADLRREAEASGSAALHGRLAAADPDRARQIHPNDLKRIVRALEILQRTGRRPSTLRREWEAPDRRAARIVGLRRRETDLDARIRRRTEAMFGADVLAEVETLLCRPASPEAQEVLGLAEVRLVLEGTIGEEEAIARIARRTRRFARKQLTFFRSFEDLTWIDVEPGEPAASVASRVVAAALPARKDAPSPDEPSSDDSPADDSDQETGTSS